MLAQTPPAPPPAPKPPPDEPPGTTIEPRVGLPEVVITEVEGAPVATMVRYIDVSERLEGCAGPYGESVEVVMVAENGRIKTSLQDTTADQAVTDCVLNALAADLADVGDIIAASGTPSDRPARVKSLVTIRFGE